MSSSEDVLQNIENCLVQKLTWYEEDFVGIKFSGKKQFFGDRFLWEINGMSKVDAIKLAIIKTVSGLDLDDVRGQS